jgi:hypothetical protein
VEFRRAVQRVDGVGLPVHRAVRVGNVVADERHSLGFVPVDDVGRGHGSSRGREGGGHVRPAPHTDLDEPVEPRQASEKRIARVPLHGGIFIAGPH